MVIFVQACYCYSGNMLIGAWIMYIGTPLYNYTFLYDDHNPSPKHEKAFMQSKMFLWPLYSYVFLTSMQWIYCLILFSDGPI